MLLLLVVVAMNCLYASVHTGSCGPNVTYSLNTSTRELTISGTGAMHDYTSENVAPWYNERSYIHEVVIKEGVTTIGSYAFLDCTNLSSITIPNSVKSIGNFAFEDNSALAAVHYTSDVAGWCGITFDNYRSNPLYYAHNLYIGNTLVTELVIPESVTEIKDYVFQGCSVTQVTIGNSVTSIGDYAFCKCSGLTSITLPNSVTSIGDYVFYECPSLSSITIGILSLLAILSQVLEITLSMNARASLLSLLAILSQASEIVLSLIARVSSLLLSLILSQASVVPLSPDVVASPNY